MNAYCPKCGCVLYATEVGYRCAGCQQLWLVSTRLFFVEIPRCSVCKNEHVVLEDGQCSKG